MNRYLKSFTLAAILYIGIFVSFLYSFDDKSTLQTKQIKSEELVKFTIIQESAPKLVKKVAEKKPKPIVKKMVKKEKATKKIKPIVKKKKEIIKKTVKKIVKKQIIKKVKHVKKIVHKKSETIVKKQIKKNKSKVTKKENNLEEIKQNKLNQKKYYTTIKEAINKNKSYPRVAVKRGIEGMVKIKFTISKFGELVSFHIVDGKKIFKKSISNAIRNSFPLTPPKGVLSSNTQLSLMVNYRLN